ncbi:UNVERIFIED_CONTAM: hypothetical protein K2H54_050764 [Gekko kuhli]
MKGRLGRRHHLHCLNALCGVCGAHGRGGRATLPFPKEAVALKVKEIMRDSLFIIEPKSLLAMRAVGELRGAEPLVGRAAGGLTGARAVSWPGMLRPRDHFLQQQITYWMPVKRPAHRARASGLMASILLDTSRLPSFNE